jgi:predicted Zn-dependent protease
MKIRRTAGALALGLALMTHMALSPALAQNQDAGKVLNNLFNSFSRPSQNNQQPNNPAGALGNLLGGGNSGKAGVNPGELIQLLSQSGDNIGPAREIEIGRQLAAVLLGSKPLHPDMNLQRYVNQLGRWISLQSSRPDLPWTFAVLDDPGFNAFAAPGGYVFVTKGLIDRVPEEAELAGILAHEISHVTGKHHLKAMRKTARSGLLTQIIGSQIKNDVGGAFSQQLLALGRDMYARGLDQEDEFEADRVAVALAARAGFDPYGLVAVLQNLRGAGRDNAAFTLTLSTHPPSQQRLDLIEKAMGNRLDGLAGLPSPTVHQRLEQIMAAARRNQQAPRN